MLETNQESIGSGPVSDAVRKDVMEALGTAAERYRNRIYQQGFSAAKRPVALSSVVDSLLGFHLDAANTTNGDGSRTSTAISWLSVANSGGGASVEGVATQSGL